MTYDIGIDLWLSEAEPKTRAAPAAVRAEAWAILEEVGRGLERDLDAASRGAERLLLLLASHGGPETRGGGLLAWQQRRIETFIAQHLAEPLLLDDLASATDLSVSHFSRLFKQSYGCSPHVYVMRQRVELARRLMLATDEPLSQIALACGLSDQSHLSKLFRKVAGQSPRAWRRLHARPAQTRSTRGGGGPADIIAFRERSGQARAT